MHCSTRLAMQAPLLDASKLAEGLIVATKE